MTLTTERMAEIAKLAIRLQQISSCAAVTSSGETVLHHTHVDEILSALHDVTAELLANREAQPAGFYTTVSGRKGVIWHNGAPEDDTAIYTAPPAPAVVKLPTEFYSDEGIVVRLEEVMAALAVVGVQYERKANAKTRCEFPASEVPEEMTGGIAMSKYKVKKSNYAQWVKGWNACRAAMLAQPVSGGYKLPESWIACSEQTPVADGAYWCWFGKEKPSVIQQRVCIWNDRNHEWCDSAVTHWMPLPVAPEGGNG
ncbi:TPA: DUF551 domain-containing protein [Serratia marcescens]